MSASTTEAAAGRVTPRRVGIWGVQPGGPEGSAALAAALQIKAGDRIVDLAPGTGDLGMDATDVNIYTWTGICPETADAGYLRASVPSAVTVPQTGTPDATGLPDAGVSAVVSEGLLAALSPDEQVAVVAEAARLLRPNGRFGIHELCVRDTGLSASAREAACESLAGVGCGALHPRTESGWRALLEDAGLEIVSTEHVALAVPGRREIMRRFGPRRGHAVWSRCGGAGRSEARKVIAAQRGRFSGIVVVARRPYAGRLRSAA